MEGLSNIVYKGKTIIYADYTNVGKDKEKSFQLLHGCAAEIMKHPPNSVLALTNVTNLNFDMDFLNVMKESTKKTAPYEKKVAIIGVKGLLKAGYNFVVGFTNANHKAFDSELEAKEWLVSD